MTFIFDYGNDRWWLRIMGIGASTHVKEIHIDQQDTKWQRYYEINLGKSK